MSKNVVVDEKHIHSMYRRDCLLLLIFVGGMWAILIPVMLAALGLTPDMAVKGIVICVAMISGLALTWGMLEVFFHIRRNKEAIYREDLENLAALKGENIE